MSNKIKQGDKVRVSKDAPWLYVGGLDRIFAISDSVVTAIEDDNEAIKCYHGHAARILIIPCKYLVKVDAEAKEAKFKKGDKVRYIGDIQEHKGEMFVIDGDIFFNDYYKQWQASSIKTTPTGRWSICNVPLSDLEPDTKPTEQTEAEKKPDVGSIKIPVEVDLTDSYWDAYAADLAKELALKVANKFNDPEQAAEYAVSVAKAVVEGLKRKEDMANETKSNSSISFLSLLFLVFLILKLCGVIDWSWWWITAPLWGGFAVLLVVLPIVGVIALWISAKKRERKPTFIDRLKKAQAEQEELLKQHSRK